MIIPSKNSELSWLTAAFGELGQKEIPGKESNPKIIQYHAATTFKGQEDEIPWCAAFVCWCLPDQGTRSAAAKSFMMYGGYMSEPLFGCVVILSRGVDKYHVGFYLGRRNGKLMVLGGNQNDEVCIRDFEPTSLLACRWPNV